MHQLQLSDISCWVNSAAKKQWRKQDGNNLTSPIKSNNYLGSITFNGGSETFTLGTPITFSLHFAWTGMRPKGGHMMKSIISVLILSFAPPTMADVSISKEYPFAPKLVNDIEQYLIQAAARDAEMQNYPVAFTIDKQNGIVLWCPPQMPNKDDKGCSLNFIIKTDTFSLTIKKSLVPAFTSQQVNDQLSKLNPNTTTDHQHFGSPFEAKDTFGSHYFCQPEGAEGVKAWQCYLHVQEAFGN